MITLKEDASEPDLERMLAPSVFLPQICMHKSSVEFKSKEYSNDKFKHVDSSDGEQQEQSEIESEVRLSPKHTNQEQL